MVAARGFFPAQRERGSVHTEERGRATPAQSETKQCRKAYINDWEPQGENDCTGIGESRGKHSRPGSTIKVLQRWSNTDGCRSLAKVVGCQGALYWPEQHRGNIQTAGCRRLHTT